MTTPKAETPEAHDVTPQPRLSDLGDGRWLWEGGMVYRDGFMIRVRWDEDEDPDNPEWCAEISGLPDRIARGSTRGYGATKEAALCDLVCALAALAQALDEPFPEPSDVR